MASSLPRAALIILYRSGTQMMASTSTPIVGITITSGRCAGLPTVNASPLAAPTTPYRSGMQPLVETPTPIRDTTSSISWPGPPMARASSPAALTPLSRSGRRSDPTVVVTQLSDAVSFMLPFYKERSGNASATLHILHFPQNELLHRCSNLQCFVEIHAFSYISQ